MVSCVGLVKRFGDFTAVGGISFEVPAGGICAMVGANGAGKTTTLGMLTGTLEPTAGEAYVAGVDVRRDPLRLREVIGVVPDNLGLFDALTVDEHLELSARVYRLDPRTARERSEQLLDLLSLEAAGDRFAADCSHGMRKKLALAMAMLHNPAVLFLDEPFEGMDPVASAAVQDELKAAAGRGLTVVFTSHSLVLVEGLAEQVVFIHGGHVVADAAPDKLPKPLAQLYFETVGQSPGGRITWLGSSQS